MNIFVQMFEMGMVGVCINQLLHQLENICFVYFGEIAKFQDMSIKSVSTIQLSSRDFTSQQELASI